MDNQALPNIPPFQPLPQIPISSSTNWSKKLFFIILGLIVVAGSVFAGIQIGKNRIIKQQSITKQPTLSPTQAVVNQVIIPTTALTIEPNPTTNPTTNWKTYTFFDNKIQFKYPSEWKRYTDISSVGYDDTENGNFSLTLGSRSNINNLQLEDFVNTISSYNRAAIKIPVLVGSRKGIQINNQENGVYYSVIYCEYDAKTVLEIDADGNRNTNQELLTKILSTFKFTN